jgi:hypothetical protein
MIDEDRDRLLFSAAVAEEIAQLQNLLATTPPLSLADIASRMATTRPILRRTMQLMDIDHPERDLPLTADRVAGAATRRKMKRLLK